MKTISIALIGCGAVTKFQHLPAVARVENVQVTLLVDKNRPRAEKLARQYSVPHVAEDYTQVWDKAEAAIVALPNSLHAPVSIDLLAHGVHVLVEKPMALTIAECDRMIAAAQKSGCILAVGLMRRFFPSAIAVKNLIDSGIMGHIRSFDLQEGWPYSWPAASASVFNRELSKGGVLMDTGVHSLDQLYWWLGDITEVDYYDDYMGGVEAECQLDIKLASGASGTVILSRIRLLRNTFIIAGENAKLEIEEAAPLGRIKLYGRDGKLLMDMKLVEPKGYQNGNIGAVKDQLAAFVSACRGVQSGIVTGIEARPSIELIERCYSSRKLLAYPWQNI